MIGGVPTVNDMTPLLMICRPARSPWLALALACLVPLSSVCSGAGTEILRDWIERYTLDEAALNRLHPLSLSPDRTERLHAFYLGKQQELAGINYATLTPPARLDYLMMRRRLQFELKELTRDQEQQQEMKELLSFTAPLIELEQSRRRMEPVVPSAVAGVLSDAAAAGQRQQKELAQRIGDRRGRTNGVVSQVTAYRAARRMEELRDTLRSWRDFYAGYDPEFTWWVKEPFERLDQRLQEYRTFIRRDLVGVQEGADDPLVGDPIGRPALLEALETDMIPYGPEELIEIGQKELVWCQKEWARAAQDLGFGDDWKKALDHVSRLYVKPGEQPKLIRELALEAIQFLEERDLVTIPALCKEIWRMEMMTPERQKVNPYFTGGEVISVSFPTDTMTHEDKIMSLRGNNVHFCRATVHHELVPGHHLQLFMASRYNTHRQLFRTPFLVEGWALYWEMLLWDLNFARSAQDRVGMLFWRTHRCARIIFSLKFHLGQMTADEAVDFLVDRVGHERRNATAEVRRSILGGYGPLYQAAYLLGGLQIRALRKECVDSGRMTNKQFHDAILRENAIPIEMIRASLLNLDLPGDYRPSWRFYPLP